MKQKQTVKPKEMWLEIPDDEEYKAQVIEKLTELHATVELKTWIDDEDTSSVVSENEEAHLEPDLFSETIMFDNLIQPNVPTEDAPVSETKERVVSIMFKFEIAEVRGVTTSNFLDGACAAFSLENKGQWFFGDILGSEVPSIEEKSDSDLFYGLFLKEKELDNQIPSEENPEEESVHNESKEEIPTSTTSSSIAHSFENLLPSEPELPSPNPPSPLPAPTSPLSSSNLSTSSPSQWTGGVRVILSEKEEKFRVAVKPTDTVETLLKLLIAKYNKKNKTTIAVDECDVFFEQEGEEEWIDPDDEIAEIIVDPAALKDVIVRKKDL